MKYTLISIYHWIITLQRLMGYTSDLQPLYSVVVAIKPTGWEHSFDAPTALDTITPKQVGNVFIYGTLCYNSHLATTDFSQLYKKTGPSFETRKLFVLLLRLEKSGTLQFAK